MLDTRPVADDITGATGKDPENFSEKFSLGGWRHGAVDDRGDDVPAPKLLSREETEVVRTLLPNMALNWQGGGRTEDDKEFSKLTVTLPCQVSRKMAENIDSYLRQKTPLHQFGSVVHLSGHDGDRAEKIDYFLIGKRTHENLNTIFERVEQAMQSSNGKGPKVQEGAPPPLVNDITCSIPTQANAPNTVRVPGATR